MSSVGICSFPGTGRFLRTHSAYTDFDAAVQYRRRGGIWPRQERQAPSGRLFRTFRVSGPGCPLADDRVALIQQVKEANDIVDVVGERLSLRPNGPTFKAVCPFHDDHRPSLDVDP